MRIALITILIAAPALAQETEACGACTELDRITTADPVPPSDLPAPPQKQAVDKGKRIDLTVPGTDETVTVYHKPGAGVYVGDLVPGGVFVRPSKNNKLSVEMKF